MRSLGHLTAGARRVQAPRAEEDVRPPPQGEGHETRPDAPASREEWLRLIEGIAPRLGLTDKALRALRVIVTACRWADFADGGAPPVCFRQQQRMAEAIGVTPGHFRKLEARLEVAGLIERRTCENGHRGRLGPNLGSGGPVAGLSLAPMLAGLPRWQAIAAAMVREAAALAEGRALIRIERRAAWRAVAELDDHHPVRRRYEALRGTGFRRAARYETEAEIAAHLGALCDVIEGARDRASRAPDHDDARRPDDGIGSGAALPEERRHTEVPTDPQTGPCSGAPGDEGSTTTPAPRSGRAGEQGREEEEERSAGCALDTARTGPDGRGDDEGPQQEGDETPPTRLPRALAARLTPALLRELGSEELRLYVDHLDPHPGPPTLRDIERAALMRRRELGVLPAVWEEAEHALGWLDALVALIVVDTNRDHPTAPVRNPAGLLRDLARRRRAGTLDLGASVMGLWKRRP